MIKSEKRRSNQRKTVKYLIVWVAEIRGPNAKAAEAFREGLRTQEYGPEVFLTEMKIDDAGVSRLSICRKEGRGDDDQPYLSIGKELRASSPPVYSAISGEHARFSDRLRRITRHEAGRKSISGKPAIGI
jgi:hypothetical protein